MTREQIKALLPVITAFAEGREIEYRISEEGPWHSDVNLSLAFDCGSRNYRIKPEPKRVPWTVATCPVGAAIRAKGGAAIPRVIIHSNSSTAKTGDAYEYAYGLLFERFEWKWPHEPESAWRPCSTEVKE